MDIPVAVHTLARDLGEIFGARLQSLVAYGLHGSGNQDGADAAGAHGAPHGAAHNAAHDAAHDAPAQTQTIAIVDALTSADLQACAARVEAWHEAALATPLLLAARDFERSLDAFPLEFGAILADHIVVSGRSPFDGLTVDDADVRRACEVQARSHLIHLREGFLETRGRADSLAVLIVASAAPFAALLHSVARLEGVQVRDHAAAGRHVERRLDVAGGIVTDVVRLAGITDIPSEEAKTIFPRYLDAVERLVEYLDTWSGR
jgi:hypothetical protein